MTSDQGRGFDRIGVAVGLDLVDHGRVRTSLRVERWDEEQRQYAMRHPRFRNIAYPGWEPVTKHFRVLNVRPYSVTEDHDCNLITWAGWAAMMGSIGGTSISSKFSATVGRIGIGTGSPTAAGGDTALSAAAFAATGSNWKLIGAAPTITATATPCTMVWSVAFVGADAVGNWGEFAVDIGTASSTVGTPTTAATAPMVNHGVSAQGSKLNTQTWTPTVTLSLT